MTPYKKPAAYKSDNKIFNYWVSHVRIRSEHAVGHLKGRFQSLKGLRQQIKSSEDHRKAVEWIRACLVIHTLIHHIEADSFDSDWQEELIEQGLSSSSSESAASSSSDAGTGLRVTAGERKRRAIKKDLFDSGITDR
jgi:hypothetical protein